MKILVVASTFPSSDKDHVPAFVKEQVKAMASADTSLQFIVLAPHDARSDTAPYRKHAYYDEYRFHYMWPRATEKLAGRGILPTLQANPLYYLVIPAFFVGEYIALLRLTRKERPDVIYAHWFTPQAIIARLVGSSTNTPFVFTTHASDVSVWRKVRFLGPRIVRSNVRKARAFTAVSRRSMAKLSSFFDSNEWEHLVAKSKILPMGIDFPSSISVSLSGREPNSNILFVGRLAEKKGVQYLLPAFADLLATHTDATLTVAGDGPLLKQLKSQAASLGLGEQSVRFPGYVTGESKQSLLNSHDIFVVPSIITASGDAEGLPVSLMEGMAAGKICIATNESGADDFIAPGKNGFLVPHKNSKLLTRVLASAIGLTSHEREVMATKARVTASQFSWDTVASEHINFLFAEQKTIE